MTDTEGLSEIKTKNITGDQFFIVTPLNKNLIKFGAPITSLLALIALGYIRKNRKNAIKKRYHIA
jgi:hypothetical protein